MNTSTAVVAVIGMVILAITIGKISGDLYPAQPRYAPTIQYICSDGFVLAYNSFESRYYCVPR